MRTTLKELVHIQVGYSFRTKIETDENGELQLLQLKNFREDGSVQVDGLNRVALSVSETQHLIQNDIVMRPGVSQLSFHLIPAISGKVIPTSPLIRLRVSEVHRVIPAYLAWHLQQPDVHQRLKATCEANHLKKFSKTLLEKYEISLPDIQVQKEILECHSLLEQEKEMMRKILKKRSDCLSRIAMPLAESPHAYETFDGHFSPDIEDSLDDLSELEEGLTALQDEVWQKMESLARL